MLTFALVPWLSRVPSCSSVRPCVGRFGTAVGGLCAGEDMPPGSKADWGETG